MPPRRARHGRWLATRLHPIPDMVRVEYRPVGRDQREWTWKARDEATRLIQISGQRFPSLDAAVRDARSQLEELRPDDHEPTIA